MSDSAWSLHHEGDLLRLSFDVPGEKVNVLREDNMEELRDRLREIADLPDVRALLIESGKESGFIAGADIHAIAQVETEAEGQEAARRGQEVFSLLEALPFPTVALIHGACVGGGLELALACKARVASTDEKTQLGLPEVQLGILPGFGGTQRLPRLLGLPAALPLLLTGSMSPARKAQRIGLVDALAPREALAAAAEKVVARLPNLSLPRRRPVVNRLCSQGPLRRWILGKARASVLARTHGQFPAPLRILESVDAAFSPGEAGGYAVEARLLGELLVSGPSRNLVRLFQLAEKAREVAEEEAPIRRVFVAGAGTMGAGIAALFASKGMRTRLFDSYPESLLKGMKFIHSLFARKVKRRGGGAAQLQAILDQLEPTPELTGLRSQDLFLEAVIEKLDVKQELLAKVEEQLPAHACIATNTSSLDLNAMATVLQRPERLVGIHFFNPVHRMRLVEIVRGSATSEAAVESARALVRRLGKVPVVVGNAPGFLVNRLLAPYLLQAERIVAEGASVEFIDRLMKQAGMPMGPLELLDEVGLDVAAHVARTMQNAFPERFQPGELVQSLCEQGDLGKKTGRGFYHHGKKVFVNHSLQKWRKSSFAMDPEVLKDRMILPVVLEGLRCLEAGIVRSDDEVDLAMLLGTGFLLPHGGPMQAAKQRGWANVLEAVEQLSAGDAAGCFQVPELLKQRVGQPEEVPA